MNVTLPKKNKIESNEKHFEYFGSITKINKWPKWNTTARYVKPTPKTKTNNTTADNSASYIMGFLSLILLIWFIYLIRS